MSDDDRLWSNTGRGGGGGHVGIDVYRLEGVDGSTKLSTSIFIVRSFGRTQLGLNNLATKLSRLRKITICKKVGGRV